MNIKSIYSHTDPDGDRIDITDEGDLAEFGSVVLRASSAYDENRAVFVLLNWEAVDDLIIALGGTPPTRIARP